MIEKLKRKKYLKLITCFILILIVIGFLSHDNVINTKTNYIIDTNLIFNALQQAKIRELEIENKYQVSAIVLHWNRLSQIQQIIQHYLNSKLFKEIIVWNNNPEIDLTHNHILMNNNNAPIPIIIINSKKNFKEEAKYQACAEAQTLVCFYADDDWDTSHYMKSLIASFRSDPNLLHSATNGITYYNNMLWTFTDRRIDLHTGFSWIDTGSVFLRDHALRHIQFLNIHLKTHQELLAYSDVFFSIWLNDMPTQMIVNLHSLAVNLNGHDKPFSSVNISDLHATSSILAIRTLEYYLRLNDSTRKLSFPRQQMRRFPYCIKTPSINDDFIFYSNILPIDIEHIPFDITLDADRATYRNIPHDQNYRHFALHNTLKAVDNNEKSCWSSLGTVTKGDFFAMDFLRIQNNIAFLIIIGHSQELHCSLDIRISFDGTWWISHQSIKGTLTNLNASPPTKLYSLVVDSNQFPLELQSFRYIAFNATYDFPESFQVCDIQIIKNQK